MENWIKLLELAQEREVELKRKLDTKVYDYTIKRCMEYTILTNIEIQIKCQQYLEHYNNKYKGPFKG